MKNGHLILVTGPAAVGKSTITKHLQSELSSHGSLWLLVQLDTFADSLMRDWFTFDTEHAPFADRGFEFKRDIDGGVCLTIGTEGRRLLAAFHRSVAAIVDSGVNVVCETVVCDDEDWQDWSVALKDTQTYWVKLTAPLAVLESREKIDRPPQIQGLAQGNLKRRNIGNYDLKLDTANQTVAEVVTSIIKLLPGKRG